MARYYSPETYKILFALSGNRCAYPGCKSLLVQPNESGHSFFVVGEIAHIHASSEGGPRGDAPNRPKEIDKPGNLLLLCPTHHVVIDKNPADHPTEVLLSWKKRIEGDEETANTVAVGDGERLLRVLEDFTARTLLKSGLIATNSPSGEKISELRLSNDLYVSRAVEKSLLQSLTSEFHDRRPLLIVGEPGVGKSSLFWSLAHTMRNNFSRSLWVLEGPAVMSLLEGGGDLHFSPKDFADLCETGEFQETPPILCIDTADVCLNSGALADRFVALLSYLTTCNAKIVIASRPEESREIEHLNPRSEFLGEYSNSEFTEAVTKYARRYLSSPSGSRIDALSSRLQDAVAQGYPILEVALNPLRLRMLFSIYAPEDINAVEINIIELYTQFWNRRVKSDIRAERQSGMHKSNDLSTSASVLGLAMLAEGRPDISEDFARHVISSKGGSQYDLDELIRRGVVRSSNIGGASLISFFHQTFFEHAAAVAVAGQEAPDLLNFLFKEYLDTSGNQFLGCVLERALVLCESSPIKTKNRAVEVIGSLCSSEEPYHSAGLYAFAHRYLLPSEIDTIVREKIASGETSSLERLLAMSGNMREVRRKVAVNILAAVLAPGAYRLNEMIFAFFLRSARQNPDSVAAAIQGSDVLSEFTSNPLSTSNARLLFFEMAPLIAVAEPHWVCIELGNLIEASLGRLAGKEDLQSGCLALEEILKFAPIAAKQTIDRIVCFCNSDREIKFAGDDPVVFGKLLSVVEAEPCSKYAQKCLASPLTGETRFLSCARLGALGHMMTLATNKEISDAIQKVLDHGSKEHAFHFGRISLGPVLVKLAGLSDDDLEEVVSAFSGYVLSEKTDCMGLMMSGLFGDRHTPVETLNRVAGLLGMKPDTLYKPGGKLFGRVVDAAVIGEEVARFSLQELLRADNLDEKITRPILTQIRNQPEHSTEMRDLSLNLAFGLRSPADTIITLLEREKSTYPDAWNSRTEEIVELAKNLIALGDPASRTRGAKLMFHLARLAVNFQVDWGDIVARGKRDKAAVAQAYFFGTAGYLMRQDEEHWEKRVHTLLSSVPKDNLEARVYIFGAIASVLQHRPKLAERLFPELFNSLFSGTSSSSTVLSISFLMYDLYDWGWQGLPDICLQLIEKTRDLSVKSSHRLYGTFAKLYLSVGRNAGPDWCKGMIKMVPTLHPEIARIILPLGMFLSKKDFHEVLNPIMECKDLPGPVVKLVLELKRRRERLGGGGTWPDIMALA